MLDGAPLLLVCGGIVMVLSKLMERALAESAMDGSRDTYGRVEVCTLLYVVLRSRCKKWAICDLDMYYTLSLIIQYIHILAVCCCCYPKYYLCNIMYRYELKGQSSAAKRKLLEEVRQRTNVMAAYN